MTQVAESPSTPTVGTPTFTLFLISVIGLFLELLLIRWVSTEIRIFAYLQNTVLVVCFLGLGMGCWDSRRKPFVLRELLVPLAVLTALLAIPTTRIALGRISEMLSGFGGLVIWGESETASNWSTTGPVILGSALTFGLMVLLWDIFVPVGRLLGKLLDEHPRPIWAYSVNVAGSLVGIWLFVGMSAAYLPPVAWFGLFAAACIGLIGTGGKSRRGDAGFLTAIVAMSAVAGYEPGWNEVRWSPYQKLSLQEMPADGTHTPSFWHALGGERVPGSLEMGRYFIGVNNIGYQVMLDLRPEHVKAKSEAKPNIYPPEQIGYSQYDLPAKFHPKPENLLIVGAGSGNDAAGRCVTELDVSSL